MTRPPLRTLARRIRQLERTRPAAEPLDLDRLTEAQRARLEHLDRMVERVGLRFMSTDHLRELRDLHHLARGLEPHPLPLSAAPWRRHW